MTGVLIARGQVPIYFLALGLALAVVSTSDAQTFTFSAGTATGVPGDTVDVPVMMDSDIGILGFSVGLAHDGAALELVEIAQGSAIAAINGGEGAAFFLFDTNPTGGPGGFVGCVMSLERPLEELPAGTGQEIVVFSYTITAAAEAGTTLGIEFTNELGNPSYPVENVASNGDTFDPALVAGSIDVLTPAVEGLTCEITDDCGCDILLSWENPVAYDLIAIIVNGFEIDAVIGTAESTTITINGDAPAEITLVPTSNLLDGPGATCTVECDCVDMVPEFKRGDANGNGTVVPLVDALYLLTWGFLGGNAPPCLDAADANNAGGVVVLVNAIYLLTWGFLGGNAPPSPGADTCGPDPATPADTVDCATVATACQ